MVVYIYETLMESMSIYIILFYFILSKAYIC